MNNIKSHHMRRIFSLLLFLVLFTGICAQIPSSYYNAAEGKSGKELKTALHEIIRSHRSLDYDVNWSIWWGRSGENNGYFQQTDWHADGYYWDMYSTDKHDIYYVGGEVQNKEHAMPRSWWAGSADYPNYDANGDLHNLFPSNSVANEAKSNYPLGTTNGGTFNNGVSKVGRSTFSGYSGEVFEPADEYKGDFARTYMYMVTCYQDYSSKWRSLSSSMISGNTLNIYSVNLLMKWHRNDPVSEKEKKRNDAVYDLQDNRNPFIDFPDLAEYIWGNLSEKEVWIPSATYSDFAVYSSIGSTNEIKVSVSRREREDVYYEIHSTAGIKVDSGNLNESGLILLENVKSGMYILTVYSVNKRFSAKFVHLQTIFQ